MELLKNNLRRINLDQEHIEIVNEIHAAVSEVLDFDSKKCAIVIGDDVSYDEDIVTLYITRDILSWCRFKIFLEKYPNLENLIVKCTTLTGSTSSMNDFLSLRDLKFFILMIDDPFKASFVGTMVFLKDWNETVCKKDLFHVFYQRTHINRHALNTVLSVLSSKLLVLTCQPEADVIKNEN